MFYDKIKLLILQILIFRLSKTPINLIFEIQTIKTIVASFIGGVWYNDTDYFFKNFYLKLY
jgi:hypothetical protein